MRILLRNTRYECSTLWVLHISRKPNISSRAFMFVALRPRSISTSRSNQALSFLILQSSVVSRGDHDPRGGFERKKNNLSILNGIKKGRAGRAY